MPRREVHVNTATAHRDPTSTPARLNFEAQTQNGTAYTNLLESNPFGLSVRIRIQLSPSPVRTATYEATTTPRAHALMQTRNYPIDDHISSPTSWVPLRQSRPFQEKEHISRPIKPGLDTNKLNLSPFLSVRSVCPLPPDMTQATYPIASLQAYGVQAAKISQSQETNAALGHKKLHPRFIPNYPPSPLHLLHAAPILCDTLQRVYQGLSALDFLFTFGLTLASNCLLCFCFLGDSESMPSCQTWLLQSIHTLPSGTEERTLQSLLCSLKPRPFPASFFTLTRRASSSSRSHPAKGPWALAANWNGHALAGGCPRYWQREGRLGSPRSPFPPFCSLPFCLLTANGMGHDLNSWWSEHFHYCQTSHTYTVKHHANGSIRNDGGEKQECFAIFNYFKKTTGIEPPLLMLQLDSRRLISSISAALSGSDFASPVGRWSRVPGKTLPQDPLLEAALDNPLSPTMSSAAAAAGGFNVL
ncbi:uncharacterized protein CLUP02_10798 [Colletotrichum lupini]|uniref:Uncharacterized protein n=1 Tax=Colletotrichum lupini TaxID=145971 RepID=A0A9Q8SZ19_9PEZI|nr:uncharacterized protein CLUP02_10798 [Colletotrichum lupini]UQC85301.1 hypothetical protein CLUP02_10798 [Colletotrichum lupini]